MMPFTISPTEAQAIQEDEAQLINAISQVAQRLPGVLRVPTNGAGQSSDETLRIKLGRRLVYGQLADGSFRHELDTNSLKIIADALQRPVTSGIDPAQYERKVPAIEISHGETLLFREERDGTVTTNEILLQVEQGSKQVQSEDSSIPIEPVAVLSEPETRQHTEKETTSNDVKPATVTFPDSEISQFEETDTAAGGFSVNRAHQLLSTAQYLLNPLRQPEAAYDEVAIHGYHIQKEAQDIRVSQGSRLVLAAHKGEIISGQVSDLDWDIFSKIDRPERFPAPILNDLPKSVANENASNSHARLEETPLQPVTAKVLPTKNSIEQPQDFATATDSPSALAVLARETENLSVSHTKQLLQATVQDWRQQVPENFSARLRQGANWLSAQQTAVQNQRLAYAVFRLFRRGYERTGEQTYHVRGCTIRRQGQDRYVLKDSVGELMKFKTSKVMGLGRRLSIVSVSDRLTANKRQTLLTQQLVSSAMPQGNLDVDAAYATKTQKVEQTVRQFLTNFAHAHTWNRENGQFKLEMGEGGTLRITDKQDGRGVVFERNKGEVSSKLGGEDFAFFDRLAAKMQTMANKQAQTAAHDSNGAHRSNSQNGASQNSANGHQKTHAIEMD